MMTWKTVSLGEILTESTIPAITSSTDRRITVRLNVRGVEKRPVGNDKEGATKYFVRKAGQFIYGRQNLHKGAFGLVPPELDGYESSQDLPAFDIAEQCEPDWLIYFLRQDNFYESLDRLARGIGSRRVNPKDLYGVEMPLPPLDEQRALLQILVATDEAADALVQDFAHQAALLTRLRQAVLREAVQGRLVPQNATDEPAPALLARIHAEKHRLVKEKKLRAEKPLPPLNEVEVPYELPEGWEWCRAADVMYTLVGHAFKSQDFSKEGIQLLRNINVSPGSVNWSEVARVPNEFRKKFTAYELELGDVVLGLDRPIISAGLKVARIEADDLPALLLQRVAKFSPILIWPDYLYLWFRSHLVVNALDPGRSKGVPHISHKDVEKIVFPLPPLLEQRRIVTKVTELLAHCTALEAELQRARQAAEALHATAMRQTFTEPVEVMVKADL